MAVQVLPLPGTMVLRLNTGVDDDGNPVYTNRRWSNISPQADSQAVYDAAQVIAGLQVHPLSTVQHQENSELVDDGN